MEVGGRRYLTSIAPIEAAGHDWSILVVAPEREFIGFVERNNRTGLVMSLAIVALVAVGGVLLARQGRRADRATRLALDRSRAIGRQSEILRQLADDPDLFDPSEGRAPLALTESAADISGAKRASLWYLLPDGQTLRCVDSFQRDASVHAAEFEVRRGELPRFFDHLAAGAEIDVSDAAADPRTAELHRLILAPLGSRALSLFPVRRQGHVIGAFAIGRDDVPLPGLAGPGLPAVLEPHDVPVQVLDNNDIGVLVSVDVADGVPLEPADARTCAAQSDVICACTSPRL